MPVAAEDRQVRQNNEDKTEYEGPRSRAKSNWLTPESAGSLCGPSGQGVRPVSRFASGDATVLRHIAHVVAIRKTHA